MILKQIIGTTKIFSSSVDVSMAELGKRDGCLIVSYRMRMHFGLMFSGKESQFVSVGRVLLNHGHTH
jgi:hypothetical protein